MGSFTLRDLSIAKKVDQLESWLRELKSSQRTGQDVVTVKESSTASTFDFTIAPVSGSYGYAYKYVIFVADTAKQVSGVIRWQVGSGNINSTAAKSQFDFAGQDLTFFEPSGNENRIVIGMNIYNNGSTTLYFKAYAEATDTGTVYVRDSYSSGDPLP